MANIANFNNEWYINEKLLDRNVNGIVLNGEKLDISIKLPVDPKIKTLINNGFKYFLGLDSWNDHEEIRAKFKKEGGKVRGGNREIATEAKVVRGSHPSLHYRGNALKRHKIWFQEARDRYLVYKYTGWQHSVVPATFVVREEMKELKELIDYMKSVCSQDQWIMTCYEDGNDFIGQHSDKTKTWVPNSSFHVIKWGASRRFRIEDLSGQAIFDKIVPSGTEIIVSAHANEMTKHGVPVMDGEIGISGSIVGRDIECAISIKEMMKNIERAKEMKKKRDEVKEKKRKERESDDRIAKRRAKRKNKKFKKGCVWQKKNTFDRIVIECGTWDSVEISYRKVYRGVLSKKKKMKMERLKRRYNYHADRLVAGGNFV